MFICYKYKSQIIYETTSIVFSEIAHYIRPDVHYKLTQRILMYGRME